MDRNMTRVLTLSQDEADGQEQNEELHVFSMSKGLVPDSARRRLNGNPKALYHCVS